MPVGSEIKDRIGSDEREHLVARSVDEFSEVFERALALLQVDAPQVLPPGASRHVGAEVEPHTVGRYRRVAVTRNGVGSYFEFYRGAPFGVGSLRGVYLNACIGIGFASCLGQIHRRTVGGERYDTLVQLAVQLPFYGFGALPFTFLILPGHPHVALLHAGDFAFARACNLLVGGGEI